MPAKLLFSHARVRKAPLDLTPVDTLWASRRHHPAAAGPDIAGDAVALRRRLVAESGRGYTIQDLAEMADRATRQRLTRRELLGGQAGNYRRDLIAALLMGQRS